MRGQDEEGDDPEADVDGDEQGDDADGLRRKGPQEGRGWQLEADHVVDECVLRQQVKLADQARRKSRGGWCRGSEVKLPHLA